MASVDGELVTVLLTSYGSIVKQQPVNFAVADAILLDLPADNYTVIARGCHQLAVEALLIRDLKLYHYSAMKG